MAKVIFFAALACLLASCFSSTHMMTRNNYEAVVVGESFVTVKKRNGTPYAEHALRRGGVEYEYVERIEMGNHFIAENRYFILVENGKVVGKYMKQELPPAYDLIYQKQPNYRPYP